MKKLLFALMSIAFLIVENSTCMEKKSEEFKEDIAKLAERIHLSKEKNEKLKQYSLSWDKKIIEVANLKEGLLPKKERADLYKRMALNEQSQEKSAEYSKEAAKLEAQIEEEEKKEQGFDLGMREVEVLLTGEDEKTKRAALEFYESMAKIAEDKDALSKSQKAEMYYKMGSLAELGRPEKAIEYYEKAVELGHPKAQAEYNRVKFISQGEMVSF